MRMCENNLDAVEGDLLTGDQAVPDREVVLPDQREGVGVERERVEGGGDGALDRVLEGDEGPVRRPLPHRDDRVIDSGGRDRLNLLIPDRGPQGVLAEGTPWAQVDDPHR